METLANKNEVIKDLKVQFIINCKCGEGMTNDQLIKKENKYYCQKCNNEIISIGKSSNENE
tara:strand:- start:286 stop:468 length:183 start_codon:yes stop_codon:yes gene_type:complete